jgi:hypothetical protein
MGAWWSMTCETLVSKSLYIMFKDFDVNKYISDLDNTVYLHDSSECVDDINIMYNDFETKVSSF